jgi:dTDP-4-amino-4,6-dideoxygalactose transaminase
VIEDAAQAIGAEYRGRKAGVLGTVGCFSFFPTKNLGGAGDGGMIVTDDSEIANRLKRLRVHGDVGGYNHVEVGFNSRLDSLQAAVLRVKLRSLDKWSEARRSNAKLYHDLFRESNLRSAIDAPPTLPDRRHIYNQYTIRVRGERRDEVMKSLRTADVGCAVYYPIPLHLQACFGYLGHSAGDFPETERACREVLSLPIYAELPDEHQRQVVARLAEAVGVESTITFPDSGNVDRRAA